MAVDPTGEILADFLSGDPDCPVVMLNLLRYTVGGRESYARYAQAFQETFAPRYGVEVIYAGNGEPALSRRTASNGTRYSSFGTRRAGRSARWSPTPSIRRSRTYAPARRARPFCSRPCRGTVEDR